MDTNEISDRLKHLEREIHAAKFCIWLEVSNVRLTQGNPDKLEVQLKADRGDRQNWWNVTVGESSIDQELERDIFDALDKKRIVLAKLTCDSNAKLVVTGIRVQAIDAGNR